MTVSNNIINNAQMQNVLYTDILDAKKNATEKTIM
jgi:uncharacterized repeat protein (TIGR01451 family)